MLKIALILALVTVLSADRITIYECRGGGPLPNWAAVPGCNMDACILENGQYIHMEAELTITVPAERISTRLNAQWLIADMNMTLPEYVYDGCNAFTGGCPINVGATELIYNSFTIESIFDNISPSIELSKTNENGELVMCVRTDIRLNRPGLA